jgi:type VI secretion system protein ImpJ
MSTHRFNPVAWTEGMFLRPQHLQHHDLFSEERLRYHLHAMDPFHWGVRELELDEAALSDHQIVILRLDAVLPGGTILRHPGNARVETREFDPSSERLDVHVGIRHISATQPNTAPSGNGARDVRYVVDTHELPDINRGGSDSPVELAHPNVRVFVTGEEPALELHESFKLAEIVATGELKRPFALSPTYAPPLLAVQAWTPLFDDVAKIVNQIAAKVRVVAGRTTTIAIADLPRMWMRYTLARMTPLLRHLLATGVTRPFDLYTALIETAGALAAFQSTEPVELPGYEHDDLYGCFRKLIDFIDVQLGETLPSRFTELKMAFDAKDKVYLTADLNAALVDARNFYYLGVKAPLDSKELNQWVVDHGKAGSRSGVKTLVMLNVEGLRLEHLPGAPTEIAAPAGFEFYKIEPHGAQWSKVKEDFTFALSLGKLENAEVRLYVVTPEG